MISNYLFGNKKACKILRNSLLKCRKSCSHTTLMWGTDRQDENIVKPAHEVTYITQSPVLKDPRFLVLSYKLNLF